MDLRHWILDENHNPVPIETRYHNGGIDVAALIKWGRFLEKRENCVVRQENVGPYFISTVFLGLDHNFFGDGPPILFETMAFDTEHRRTFRINLGKYRAEGEEWKDIGEPERIIEHTTIGEDIRQDRYATWDEALAGHEKIVAWLKDCLARSSAEVEECFIEME